MVTIYRLEAGWPVAVDRPGFPPLWGVLQHQLQPYPNPSSSHSIRAFATTPSHKLTDTRKPVKVYMLNKDQHGTTRALGMLSSYAEQLKGMSSYPETFVSEAPIVILKDFVLTREVLLVLNWKIRGKK